MCGPVVAYNPGPRFPLSLDQDREASPVFLSGVYAVGGCIASVSFAISRGDALLTARRVELAGSQPPIALLWPADY